MKFYDCSTAPSPRRVRIFLAEKGIEPEVVEVDLRNGEHLGEAFRAINPDCTVPVLELDDGTHITEAFAICQYLESVQPEPPLLGRDAREQALVTMWLTKVEQQGLAAIAEALRNKAGRLAGRALTGPHAFEQIPALVERGARRIQLFMDRLDGHLSGTQYLAGDVYSIADITALVAIDFANRAKFEIGDRPNLKRWYDEAKGRPASAV